MTTTMRMQTAATTDADRRAFTQPGTLTLRIDKMKRAFAVLLMTTGLCAGFGAGSVVLAAGQGLPLRPDASPKSWLGPGAPLTLIDDDGDEGEGSWFWSLSDDDDDDDDVCEEDDDDEGSDDCSVGAAGNAAKAGTVPPPQNGLFTDGAAPVVTSN